MQIEINQEMAELRNSLRRFTTEKLEPFALEIDRTSEVPQAAIDLLRDTGYLGIRLPEELGGGGADLATYCLALEEFSRSHRVFTTLLDGSSGLNPIAIAKYGTDAQKQRYVPGLADGSLTAAFALTEPGSWYRCPGDSDACRTA